MVPLRFEFLILTRAAVHACVVVKAPNTDRMIAKDIVFSSLSIDLHHAALYIADLPGPAEWHDISLHRGTAADMLPCFPRRKPWQYRQRS